MKRQIKGEDIYNTFKTYAMEISLCLHKLRVIATDGAPGMLGSINGFIHLCKKDATFPDFISYIISYIFILSTRKLCVSKYFRLDKS
jgi:hypothetical protein